MKYLLIFLVALLASVQSALSAEFSAPRAAGVAFIPRLGSPNAASQLNAPFTTDRSWSVESGYIRKFETRDLDEVFIAGSVQIDAIGLALGISQVGNGHIFTEQTLKSTACYQVSNFIAGLGAEFHLLSFPGSVYKSQSIVSTSFSIGYEHIYLKALFVADDLFPISTLSMDQHGRRPSQNLIIEHDREDFSFHFRIRTQDLSRPRLSFGQRIRLARQALVSWGLITKQIEFCGGLELRAGTMEFSYAATIHTDIGLSHYIGVGYGSAPALTGIEQEL